LPAQAVPGIYLLYVVDRAGVQRGNACRREAGRIEVAADASKGKKRIPVLM
jgi:hypothetical protein